MYKVCTRGDNQNIQKKQEAVPTPHIKSPLIRNPLVYKKTPKIKLTTLRDKK